MPSAKSRRPAGPRPDDRGSVIGGDASCLFLLTLAAGVTRLWRIDLPATPVYDETHVGRFLNWRAASAVPKRSPSNPPSQIRLLARLPPRYHQRAYFFDVHPPLAKLAMYRVALALGFRGAASCPYESTEPFAAECDLAPQRLLPALCGTAMVPVAFITARAAGLSRASSLLAAYLVLSDNLFLALSRLHLNDIILALLVSLTHLAALSATRAPPRDAAAPLPLAPLMAAGLALGGALQCKYGAPLTTLGWLGLQNLLLLCRLAAQGRSVAALLRQAAARGAILLGLPLAMHVAMLRLHLSLLPNSGDGDGYMSEGFQATLAGNPLAASLPPGERPSFLALALEHAATQFRYNRNMAILFPRGSHAFDSRWYSWPLAARGVHFSLVRDWAAVAAAPDDQHLLGLFIHPNPAIALAAAAAAAAAAARLAALALGCARERLRGAEGAERAARLAGALSGAAEPGGTASLLCAMLLHWLPYATQDRQTFLLYYAPAYYFAILIAAAGWDALVVRARSVPRRVGWALTAAAAAFFGSFTARLWRLAVGAPATPHEWHAMLRLASTECWAEQWLGETCWASQT